MRPADRYYLLAQAHNLREGGYLAPNPLLADALCEYLMHYAHAQDRLAADIWVSMRCFGRPDIVPCVLATSI